MANIITFNGSSYTIPDVGEVDWGQNVTDFLTAIPNGALQPTGGLFSLSADVDFGSNFGLESIYYKSRTANIATVGIVRLARVDGVVWRNQANGGDLILGVDALDRLTFNGIVLESDTLPSSQIFVGNGSNESTAVAMTGDLGIDNTGLTAITGDVIVNADINTAAGIVFSKMAALTTNAFLVTNGSGFAQASVWSYDVSTNIVTTGTEDALRFVDSGSNYVGIVAPTTITASYTVKLPIAVGAIGEYLSYQAAGQLQWLSPIGSGTVASGVAGRFAYYPTTNTTVDDQTALSLNGANVEIAGGNLVMNANKITGLGAATVNGDALRYEQLVGVYLPLAGGTMAGDIAMGGTQKLTGLVAGSGAGDSLRYEQVIGIFLPLSGGTMTGAILGPDGAVGTPTYTFASDPNTGMWLNGVNNLRFSFGGASKFVIGPTYNESQQTHYFVNGSVGTPSISFGGDVDTGMFWSSADQYEFVAGGATRFACYTGGLFMQSGSIIALQDGAVGTPSLTFGNDTNTGLSWWQADYASLDAGGIRVGSWFENSGNSGLAVLNAGSGSATLFLDASNGDMVGSDYVQIVQDNALDLDFYNLGGAVTIHCKASDSVFFQNGTTNICRVNSSGFFPQGSKAYDSGDGSSNWDNIYADDFVNVADIPFFDVIKDKDGNETIVDDIAVIRAIKPAKDQSGKIKFNENGYAFWDDDTLPEWLWHKDKDDKIARDDAGRPWISMKVLGGLALGGVNALINVTDDHEARIKKLEEAE